MWGFIFEDLPEEANRVELDPERTDDHGIPAAKLYYEMSENSRRMVEFHEQRADGVAARGRRLRRDRRATDPGDRLAPARHLHDGHGSGELGGRSWGRCHDVPNLFIFDGSVWPTSSGMNPTATIAALALRFTDHLIAERRDQERPL